MTRKYCVYNVSNDEQSNHTVSAVDEFDTKCLRFLEDEHVLDSYMLQLAERGRWFVVGCDGPSVAGADVSATEPMHRVSHQLNDEAWKLWLRELYENAMAQNDLDKSSSNSSESDSESDLANFESALGRKYGSSVEEILSRRVQININATDGQGRTLLHHAAEQGNVDAVRMLLAIARQDGTDARLRLDVNKQDKDGSTALILAVIGIKSEVMASKQSEVTTNSQSSTRVRDSRLSVIEELLAAGANVNLVDK